MLTSRWDDVANAQDVWAKLAAPMDGTGVGAVRQRLDAVVPGEWELTLDLLPESNEIAFKARLQILGVIREAVGTGRDYTAAAADAFLCAARGFGIGEDA